ncbi:MAG: hypothetical protein CL420_01860 [Acidimicrobiaceae bacterium]|jgi:hypothetical protein|nr:hypothetical protein [Acidimicrobiaceae bacterium]|tara:strand:- start:29 stop:319 length:291 start_codon:yes stop_codon:yes gene_type:complete
MKFIQVMEFKSTIEEAQKGLEEYIEVAGSKTTARVVTICVDRDDPETIIQIIEFDSYESAMQNNELDETQESSSEHEENVGSVTFRNLDVAGVYEL